MILTEEEYLKHYGILRRSGRYPWGSGETQTERNRTYLETIENLRKQGWSETEIARSFSTPDHPFTTTMLRAAKTIARNEERQAQIIQAEQLRAKGYSNGAIAERMNLAGESTVRALLAPGNKERNDILLSTSALLKEEVERKQFVQIGSGVEARMQISKEKLNAAVAVLREQGYSVHTVQVDQLGTTNKTSIKVLAPPGTSYADVAKNKEKIQLVDGWTEDGGLTYSKPAPPLSIDSKRISVRYKEQGGDTADGVIYVRPGVEDISLGSNRYAQVRVMVDNTHYLKGMAMYKDDLPDGVDLVFNTNKSNTGNKLDAMKEIKSDPDLPFGAITRQISKKDHNGNDIPTSVMNIVNEEADWEKWSSSISSQMLSKQSPKLAKQQLDMTYERRQKEFESISQLTNAEVKKKLLEDFADGTDAAAVHLKAAPFSGQKTHVILPVNSMKDTEVYAPNYENGDRVVLVRFPHGGIFEIPELTVNNRNAEAKKSIGTNAPNAIGINSKVAARLSGADFDGDTVLVIPNRNKQIKTKPPLEGLKDFDPKIYKNPPGVKFKGNKQQLMGDVSNLITDMTIKGASDDELARAVRHSMVVIDSEKHDLNYKQSAINNGIAQLKEKYQGGARKGASTLISKKKQEEVVPERRVSYSVDKETGEKIFKPTGATYVNAKGETVTRTSKVSKILEARDVNTLSSGSTMEKLYADHSNKLKDLANQARKEAVNTQSSPYSPSARTAYASEVTSLNAKLNVALRNAPLEKQAQIIGNAVVSQKRAANPGMESSELKKVRSQALIEARARTGALKTKIEITDSEWDAIQAGAISSTKLSQILDNADMKRVRELATPRSEIKMTSAKKERAASMLALGYTQADVAAALGVSLTTLKRSLTE